MSTFCKAWTYRLMILPFGDGPTTNASEAEHRRRLRRRLNCHQRKSRHSTKEQCKPPKQEHRHARHLLPEAPPTSARTRLRRRARPHAKAPCHPVHGGPCPRRRTAPFEPSSPKWSAPAAEVALQSASREELAPVLGCTAWSAKSRRGCVRAVFERATDVPRTWMCSPKAWCAAKTNIYATEMLDRPSCPNRARPV